MCYKSCLHQEKLVVSNRKSWLFYLHKHVRRECHQPQVIDNQEAWQLERLPVVHEFRSQPQECKVDECQTCYIHRRVPKQWPVACPWICRKIKGKSNHYYNSWLEDTVFPFSHNLLRVIFCGTIKTTHSQNCIIISKVHLYVTHNLGGTTTVFSLTVVWVLWWSYGRVFHCSTTGMHLRPQLLDRGVT